MRVAMFLLLAGCDRIFGFDPVLPPPDAPIDARVCVGTGLLNVCTTTPDQPVQLKTAIDTASDPRCGGEDPTLCTIVATDITVNEATIVTGTRPLVLVATGTIRIANVLDASSTGAGRTGAGAQSCASGNGTPSAGGGAGGSFQYMGGPGGYGSSGGASGGTPGMKLLLTSVRGGCAGGKGGGGARGGAGGGAVYLIAHDIDVTIDGAINASGAGGGGGGTTSGGGGGGSGGLIALDANTVTIDGSVFARGGAGGGGGGTMAGGDGADATVASGQVRGGPPGGSTASGGGDGCGGTDGGIVSQAATGAGGGGGGCGYIRIYGNRAGMGMINPAPS